MGIKGIYIDTPLGRLELPVRKCAASKCDVLIPQFLGASGAGTLPDLFCITCRTEIEAKVGIDKL